VVRDCAVKTVDCRRQTSKQAGKPASGSVSEVKSLSYAAIDIGYIDENIFNKITGRCMKLTNLLNGFIRYLNNSDRKK